MSYFKFIARLNFYYYYYYYYYYYLVKTMESDHFIKEVFPLYGTLTYHKTVAILNPSGLERNMTRLE